jgi:hypothetical protein
MENGVFSRGETKADLLSNAGLLMEIDVDSIARPSFD